MYVNAGAFVDDERPQTKEVLERAIADNPQRVRFDRTSFLDQDPNDITGSNIPKGMILTVVGPDPFTDRQWYASVVRRSDGTVGVY